MQATLERPSPELTPSSDLPPVILLDFDGVINAKRCGWYYNSQKYSVAISGDGISDPNYGVWDICWEPDVINHLERMHLRGIAEVRWCSTWCPWADRLEAAMGVVTPFERAWTEVIDPGWRVDQAKRKAALDVRFKEGRRVVWIDDSAITAGPDFDAIKEDGQGLFVVPDPTFGLQPRDIVRVEAFCTLGVVPE